MGIEELRVHLQETLTQLLEYYSGIEEKEKQKHLDILTTVLGCLGLASLMIELNNFYSSSPDSSTASFYIPMSATIFNFILGVALILYWRI